jgi:hypothetical protein
MKVDSGRGGEVFCFSIHLSLSQKAEKSYALVQSTKVANHLVPNRISGFLNFRKSEEKLSVFEGLQKPLSAQIQGKLKMRRCRLQISPR